MPRVLQLGVMTQAAIIPISPIQGSHGPFVPTDSANRLSIRLSFDGGGSKSSTSSDGLDVLSNWKHVVWAAAGSS